MDKQFDYVVIKGGRLLDPSQDLDMIGDIVLGGGKILWYGEPNIAQESLFKDGARPLIFNARGLAVTPGFIDLHCHLREPGFEDKETIASGTRAAAKGGFTTICCMPNTNPPVDSAATVEYIFRKAEEVSPVRVLPVGCISKGRKGEYLSEMGELSEAGVIGYSDDGSPVMNSSLMLHAMEYSTSSGLPVIDHCEDLALSGAGAMNEGEVASALGLKGIPAVAEEIMVARDIKLAELTGARLHIAHISTAGSMELIRAAKEKGINVTCEVTPHHLTLSQECVRKYDSNAKVNPPLRTEKDIAALCQGLEEGIIDAIATDHAPHTLEDKLCEFDMAASGISGFETAFASVITLAKGVTLRSVIRGMTWGPAKILLKPNVNSQRISKVPSHIGTLKVGAPADVAVFDTEKSWRVDTKDFLSKGKNTPIAGKTLNGKIIATFAGGKVAYMDEPGRLGK